MHKSSDDDEPSSSTPVTLNAASAGLILEPYDQPIPAHVIRANGMNVYGGCVSLSLLSNEQDYIPDANPPSYETRFQLPSSNESEDKSGASSLLIGNASLTSGATTSETNSSLETVIDQAPQLIDFDQQALDDEMLIHEDGADEELMVATDEDSDSVDVLHARLNIEPLYTLEEEEESRDESAILTTNNAATHNLSMEEKPDHFPDALSVTRPPSVGTCSSLFASPAVVRRNQTNDEAQAPSLDSPSSCSIGGESIQNRNSSLSLAEFERLEQECVGGSTAANRSNILNRTQRSRHDSLESIGSIGSSKPTAITSSHSSLNEFERLESEFVQQSKIGHESDVEAVDAIAPGEEKVLSEIEEGHESQASDSVVSISGGSILPVDMKDDHLDRSDDSDIEFELDSKLDEYTSMNFVYRTCLKCCDYLKT